MFSWCDQLLVDIQQTYDLVKSKYEHVGLTGSAAIFYIIMKNDFFSDNKLQYLTEVGFSETIKPNDIDFMIFSNEPAINANKIGSYVSNQTMTSSKTFKDPDTNKSFDLILYTKGKCMKLHKDDNIYIVSAKIILSLYEKNQNKESDINKVRFINKYSHIMLSETIEYDDLNKKQKFNDRRCSFYNNVDNKPTIKINKMLFEEDDEEYREYEPINKVNKMLFEEDDEEYREYEPINKVNKMLFESILEDVSDNEN
jgi:hypothetical protein